MASYGFVDSHWPAYVPEVGAGVYEVVLVGRLQGLAVAFLVLGDPWECHVDAASLLDGADGQVPLEAAVHRVARQVRITYSATIVWCM